jgi:glycerol kinase
MSKDYDLVMVEETETHIFWEYTDGKPQMNLTLWQKTLRAKEASE